MPEENLLDCPSRRKTPRLCPAKLYPPGLMIGRILNRFIVSGYGSGDMSYEEYFSKERYIESLSDMGTGSLEWGGNHCSFFIRTLEGPVEIYRNRWPMENAYFFDRTVIYFV